MQIVAAWATHHLTILSYFPIILYWPISTITFHKLDYSKCNLTFYITSILKIMCMWWGKGKAIFIKWFREKKLRSSMGLDKHYINFINHEWNNTTCIFSLFYSFPWNKDCVLGPTWFCRIYLILSSFSSASIHI